MAQIKIGFWNVQNLFDITASEIAAGLNFTPAKNWDQAALDAKIANLANVIGLMHNGQGPDLLGICEVENENVASMLISKCNRPDYELAHIESPDIRGIDTSLIFSKNVFELVEPPVGHLIHLRYPTRDIFEVKLRVRGTNTELKVLVNHWPSRRLGRYETEPYRLAVANHCGKLVDKTVKFSVDDFLPMPDTTPTLDKLNERWNDNVLLMGDFNDEPFDRSVLDELKASNGEDKLEEEIKKSKGLNIPSPERYLKLQAYLFNCMWRFLALPDEGTFYYSGSTNTMNLLDQFIASRGLYYGFRHLKIDLSSVEIFKPSIMSSRTKGRPVSFNKRTKKGFSDHFPIQAIVETI